MRGALAAVGVLVVIGAIVLFSGGPSGTTPSNPKNVDNPPAKNNDERPAVLKPVRIVLECEEPATLEDKTKDGTQIIFKKEQNEGVPIAYLEIKSGFIDECSLQADKATAGKLPGRATYKFEVPRADTYYLHLRAKWRDNCGNAVWVAMDKANGPDDWIDLSDQLGRESEKNFKWWWHTLMVGGTPRGFKLEPGPHTLLFNVQKDGPKLDQWLISTDPQAPVGQDPVKNNS
jgi:hypothetical protein